MNDAVTPPTLTAVSDDEYLFTWDCGIQATVDRIAEHSHELSANISISSTRPPSPGSIYPAARINLMSPQTRDRLANACAKRDPDLDWDAIIGQMCVKAQDRWRAGEPAIDMRTYQMPTTPRWLLEPFVERDDATVVFAQGGSGKSMFALAVAVTIGSGHEVVGRLNGATGPVMYLDWETGPATFRERIGAICAGAGIPIPPVHYRRMVSSLPESAAEVAKERRRIGAVFAVVDSLGMARGGEPESADLTIRTFKAGRQMGVPWLAVDHVTKADGREATEPFGSAYTRNAARLMWSLTKAQTPEGSQIALRLRKANNGSEGLQAAYSVSMASNENDRLSEIHYMPIQLDQSAFTDRVPIKRRIEQALVHSLGMTRAELVTATAGGKRNVENAVSELKGQQKLLEMPGGYLRFVRADDA